MADDAIDSPPYPSLQAVSRTLYHQLMELRTWVENQQVALRGHDIPEKAAEKLERPANIPADTVWEGVSVNDKWTSLMYLRAIRESWDAALRDHEDAWDSKMALKRRYNIVLMAQEVLDEAFVSPEVREMRQVKAQDSALKRMKMIREHLKKLALPAEMQDDDESSFSPEHLQEPGEPEDDDWSGWDPRGGE